MPCHAAYHACHHLHDALPAIFHSMFMPRPCLQRPYMACSCRSSTFCFDFCNNKPMLLPCICHVLFQHIEEEGCIYRYTHYFGTCFLKFYVPRIGVSASGHAWHTCCLLCYIHEHERKSSVLLCRLITAFPAQHAMPHAMQPCMQHTHAMLFPATKPAAYIMAYGRHTHSVFTTTHSEPHAQEKMRRAFCWHAICLLKVQFQCAACFMFVAMFFMPCTWLPSSRCLPSKEMRTMFFAPCMPCLVVFQCLPPPLEVAHVTMI